MTLEEEGAAARPSRSAAVEPWKWAAGAAALAAVLGISLYFLLRAPTEYTDDAYIDAHVVPVGARVAGYVKDVLVDDNQIVKAGDLLAELDPHDFQARLNEAKGKVASQDAVAVETEADLRRAQALFARDEVSKQELEHAQAAADAAKADLAQWRAALDQAALDLSYARITAPEAGRVTRRAIERGAYVTVGQTLLALVPNEAWVTANFKETQLRRMHLGQTAHIRVDAYPDHPLRGHVDSIQDGTGARFSLLPAENATGNFVKVVQRVPVKIVLDEEPSGGRLLAPGMSVEATVDIR
ncbi:MAG TPA: HlyD family secretion protein [Elusimicrobiota bacterium]|jgi:membrane fusion protein (multidrug efflux system)|nr:HlyD family secretion protein [Elusimicrobiota bacterium]